MYILLCFRKRTYILYINIIIMTVSSDRWAAGMVRREGDSGVKGVLRQCSNLIARQVTA